MKKYFTNNTDSKEKDEVEFLNENTVSVNKKNTIMIINSLIPM